MVVEIFKGFFYKKNNVQENDIVRKSEEIIDDYKESLKRNEALIEERKKSINDYGYRVDALYNSDVNKNLNNAVRNQAGSLISEANSLENNRRKEEFKNSRPEYKSISEFLRMIDTMKKFGILIDEGYKDIYDKCSHLVESGYLSSFDDFAVPYLLEESKDINKFLEAHPEYKDKKLNEICCKALGIYCCANIIDGNFEDVFPFIFNAKINAYSDNMSISYGGLSDSSNLRNFLRSYDITFELGRLLNKFPEFQDDIDNFFNKDKDKNK